MHTNRNLFNKDFLRRKDVLIPLIGIPLIVIIFTVVNPRFLSLVHLESLQKSLSILLVLGIAQTFVVLMGSIDMSLAAVGIASGVVITEFFLFFPDTPLWPLALLVALAVGGIFGVVNGFLVSRLKIPSFVATLATWFIADGLSYSMTRGSQITLRSEGFRLMSLGEPIPSLLNMTLIALGIWVLTMVLASRTTFGKHVYAVGGGEAECQLAGINTRRTKFLAFALAGLLAGVAGILLTSYLGTSSPYQGRTLQLQSIMAVALGGTAMTGGLGGPQRTLLGSFIVVALIGGLTLNGVPFVYQELAQGIIALAVIAITLERRKLPFIK